MHICTYDGNGGAPRAAFRIHKGLCYLGHDSTMYVCARYSDDPDVITYRSPVDLPNRMLRLLRRRRMDHDFAPYRLVLGPKLITGSYYTNTKGELFSDSRSEYGVSFMRQLPPYDVINLHWIAGFLDYRLFFHTLPSRTPIVWRLSDMNPFTGGCHYDDGCGNFQAQCGRCPALNSSNERDLSRKIWLGKQAALKGVDAGKLHIVAPSRWMADQARRSSLLRGYPVTIIPSGIDTEVFAPRDRKTARDVLDIPQDSEVVLFVSGKVGNARKGFDLLKAALSKLQDREKLFLLSVGGGRIDALEGFAHLHVGRIKNDRWLSLVYSAADIFVIPSRQDNFPSTVLEAMACGTPVVGFEEGGIGDMVKSGITGQLTPSQDAASLCRVILALLDDQTKRKEMEKNCRQVILEEYTLEMQARRYADFYNSLL